MTQEETGIVIIGRNEGDRLIACLASVQGQARHVVYVDSGSTDGSQDAAMAAGAQVVLLKTSSAFTAARARNTGLDALLEFSSPPTYVQFIDGDCILQPGWIDAAHSFLRANTKVAVTCGRRQEQFPEASVYNRLIDQEWDTPIGEALACGGDALIRVDALREVDGFNPDLIAGEEPELCVRLRQAGWIIWRLDAQMTLHDAALTRFSQWWRRNQRAGHAFAEGQAMHGGSPEYHGVRETRSSLFWGGALPLIALLGLTITPWSVPLLLAWPIQVLRLWSRGEGWPRAFFLLLGKLPETQGIIGYFLGQFSGKRKKLIEYK